MSGERYSGKFSHFAWDAVVVWKNGCLVKATINAKFKVKQFTCVFVAKLGFVSTKF